MRASAPRSAHAAREGFATAGLARLMASKLSKHLSKADFASLLTVGNTCAVLEPPAVIPVERSARLVVALGYKAPNDYARQSADSSGIRKQAATATGTLRWPYLSRRTSAMRSFSHAFSCSRDSTVRWSKSTKDCVWNFFGAGGLYLPALGYSNAGGRPRWAHPPCHPSGV